MEQESPTEVATLFLKRFSDGDFGEANNLIHPEGPIEGVGDIALIVSLMGTDLLASFILKAVPTEVSDTTVVEEGPTTASIDTSLIFADLGELVVLVELRPADHDGNTPGDGRRDGWKVWNANAEL